MRALIVSGAVLLSLIPANAKEAPFGQEAVEGTPPEMLSAAARDFDAGRIPDGPLSL